MAVQEKVRIAFDFESRTDAIEWFNALKEIEAISSDAAAFEMKLADMKKGHGVTPKNTYLVLREGEREENLRLIEQYVICESKVLKA